LSRNQSRFVEKKSTELTVVFMMTEGVFIAGKLDGVNLFDGIVSTELTEVPFIWKNWEGLIVVFDGIEYPV